MDNFNDSFNTDGNFQITNPALGGLNQSAGQDGLGFFSALLPAIVSLLFVIGSIIFFFMLAIGAIQWISSAGDKGALEGARGRIVNALTGIIILFSAYAIVTLVENFFGISILTLDIGSLTIQ